MVRCKSKRSDTTTAYTMLCSTISAAGIVFHCATTRRAVSANPCFCSLLRLQSGVAASRRAVVALRFVTAFQASEAAPPAQSYPGAIHLVVSTPPE
jgi:hypothetical protein